MFAGTFALLLTGFPVAFSLAGSAILFAWLGEVFEIFDDAFLSALPERIYGIMLNQSLLAIPMFILMGVILERSKISEDLLTVMGELMGRVRGGLGLAVCLVGGLLAASTGIVGATVVTMGLISLPVMLKQKYSPAFSTGIICASGTLGQIIPPSIVLIILGDVIGSAHQQAQLEQGIFSPTSVSVADLFVGALVPGLILMGLYLVYVLLVAFIFPDGPPS
ncbi:MAG: TRAP transporter large permease subunit [Bdellovibrionales bacterium]